MTYSVIKKQSNDGVHTINGRLYETKKPFGVLVVAHGMAEHVARYVAFAEHMADAGLNVCLFDFLGHGDTVNNENERGFFADENGYDIIVKDLALMLKCARKEKLPLFLLGHSMGSLISRTFLARMDELGCKIDGCILSGTLGPPSPFVLNLERLIIRFMKGLLGNKYRSSFIDKAAFGVNNARIKNPQTKHDWLTRDTSIVDAFKNDKKSQFIFTLSGFLDVLTLLSFVSDKSWPSKISKTLPILLLSGDADPCGGYGKGVLCVYDRLKLAACNVTLKMYKDGRHEMLNEINRLEVYKDLLNFLRRIST